MKDCRAKQRPRGEARESSHSVDFIRELHGNPREDWMIQTKMKKQIAALILIVLLGGMSVSKAEVKRVEMRLAGFLCGN